MKRVAFTMKLKAGYSDEYKRRHDEIWPELKSLISKAGISDYSIFLDEETGTLFAVQKVAESAAGSQELGSHEIVQQWWEYMADIMDTNSDSSPVSVSLKEVFHLD